MARRGPKIRGMGKVQRNIQKLARAYPNAAVAAMYKEEERVMANAKGRTPVDTGMLRDSGHADPPKIKMDVIQGRVGFDKNYAAAQHEHTEYHHTVGEAKYLEKAMNDEQGGMARRVETEIKGSVGLL